MMRAADQERFEAVVGEQRAVIMKICRSFCRSADDREDLAQEIAVELWRSFRSYDNRASFATWTYRVAFNVAISFRRRQERRVQPVVVSERHLISLPDADSEPPEAIRRMYEFIEQQGALDRAVMLLYLDGYPYREISETVGIRETNVATKIGRLKRRLHAFLTQPAPQ